MSNTKHIKSVSQVVSFLAEKYKSLLSEEPLISSEWKSAKEVLEERQMKGWIDKQGRKQGRWKGCKSKYLVDYVDDIVQTKITLFITELCTVVYFNKPESLYEFYQFDKFGNVEYYFQSIFSNDSIIHGWFYNGQKCVFYHKNKVVICLHQDNDTIEKICLLQRLTRRKAFNRRFSLFTTLKFLPIEILTIINSY